MTAKTRLLKLSAPLIAIFAILILSCAALTMLRSRSKSHSRVVSGLNMTSERAVAESRLLCGKLGLTTNSLNYAANLTSNYSFAGIYSPEWVVICTDANDREVACCRWDAHSNQLSSFSDFEVRHFGKGAKMNHEKAVELAQRYIQANSRKNQPEWQLSKADSLSNSSWHLRLRNREARASVVLDSKSGQLLNLDYWKR